MWLGKCMWSTKQKRKWNLMAVDMGHWVVDLFKRKEFFSLIASAAPSTAFWICLLRSRHCLMAQTRYYTWWLLMQPGLADLVVCWRENPGNHLLGNSCPRVPLDLHHHKHEESISKKEPLINAMLLSEWQLFIKSNWLCRPVPDRFWVRAVIFPSKADKRQRNMALTSSGWGPVPPSHLGESSSSLCTSHALLRAVRSPLAAKPGFPPSALDNLFFCLAAAVHGSVSLNGKRRYKHYQKQSSMWRWECAPGTCPDWVSLPFSFICLSRNQEISSRDFFS